MLAYRIIALGGAGLATVFACGVASAQSTGMPDTTSGGSNGQTTQTDAVNPQGAVVGPAPDQNGQGGIEDIIVTARKRAAAEVLQKTPVTASAFSGDQLAKSAAVNLADVGRLTPGVSFQGNNIKGQQNFNIRGVGTSGSTAADEPTVGVFQDGVYLAGKAASLGELFDLESVQILRGPQGTLFGRNVTGGAVVVETHRPDFETSARVGLGYANGDSKEESIVFNTPIAEDVAAARIGVLHRDTDGLFDYLRTGGKYGKENVWLIRPSLLLKPTGNLDILLRGEYYHLKGDPSAVRGIVPSNYPGAPITSPQRAGYVMPDDYFAITGDRGYTNQKTKSLSLQIDWRILGGVLTSVTGFRSVAVDNEQDYDGTPIQAFQTTGMFRQHQSSTELRYARSIGSLINFTAGLYYFHQYFQSQDKRTLDSATSVLASQGRLKAQDSYAAFAEVDVNITQELTLTLGGRYNKETKTADLAPYGKCSLDFAACAFGAARSVTDNNFSPKAALSYHIAPDNLVYTSVTRAFRSGGFSLSAAGALPDPYLAEQVTQYEIGTKNDFLNHRLRVNASIYQTEYKNIQRTVTAADPTIGIITSIFNAASATIKGFELGVNAQVLPWLRFDSVYGYTHARYNEFLGIANPGALRFVRVPQDTGSAGATVTHHFNGGSSLEARGTITFTGAYFYDDANLLSQKAYNLIDGTLVYRPSSDRFSIALFAKNIGNTKYASYGAALGTRGQDIYPGNPRSYGVKLGVDF